jgi:hypothetical protein
MQPYPPGLRVRQCLDRGRNRRLHLGALLSAPQTLGSHLLVGLSDSPLLLGAEVAAPAQMKLCDLTAALSVFPSGFARLKPRRGSILGPPPLLIRPRVGQLRRFVLVLTGLDTRAVVVLRVALGGDLPKAALNGVSAGGQVLHHVPYWLSWCEPHYGRGRIEPNNDDSPPRRAAEDHDFRCYGTPDTEIIA